MPTPPQRSQKSRNSEQTIRSLRWTSFAACMSAAVLLINLQNLNPNPVFFNFLHPHNFLAERPDKIYITFALNSSPLSSRCHRRFSEPSKIRVLFTNTSTANNDRCRVSDLSAHFLHTLNNYFSYILKLYITQSNDRFEIRPFKTE